MAAGSGAGYVLGMSVALTDGAAVWVHSREESAGLKVSTQFMYVDSSVLSAYQGSEAFAGAAESYGGINTQAVYLNPRSSGAGSVVVTPVAPSGGGSETPSGGGPQAGGGLQDGGGGDDEPGGDDH